MASEEVKNQDNTETPAQEELDSNPSNEAEQTKESTNNGPELTELEKLQLELADAKDKYLRLYSDFDNFRRRTAKERIELVKTAGEDVIVSLLSVLDDFERALKSMEGIDEKDPVKEGILLIQNKLSKNLEAKGLKEMNAMGEPFNSDLHEAITQIPAPEESQKGKVMDVIEKGYYLNEKVIRFAKVVIGA